MNKIQHYWHRKNLLSKRKIWFPYFFGWRDLKNRLKLWWMRPSILQQPRHWKNFVNQAAHQEAAMMEISEDHWVKQECGLFGDFE